MRQFVDICFLALDVVVGDLAGLQRRPPEALVVHGQPQPDEHGGAPLHAHAFALVHLRLSAPREEGRDVLGHLLHRPIDYPTTRRRKRRMHGVCVSKGGVH